MLHGIKKIKREDKSGISLMVGYVLLVSLAVVMGGILYAWMKSYVPQPALECPEGTSMAIKSYSYDCSGFSQLNITIVNSGRFDIAGYFIHTTTKPDQSVATTAISKKLVNTTGEVFKYENSLIIMGENGKVDDNYFSPNKEITNVFDVSSIGRIYSIEIIPTRWQTQDNRLRYVSCGEASKFKEIINCG